MKNLPMFVQPLTLITLYIATEVRQGKVRQGEYLLGGGIYSTYAIASIISSPISTAFLAWSEQGSGRPETQ